MASSTISLCQSSIHNFISSIPSQASELAVNAVNNFIEDQVADPKKFERNITRVRSVFAGREPHTIAEASCFSREDGAGDCPCSSETKLLLNIPRKVRHKIWHFLDDNSVKVLRSVCQQLKHEMDYDVGLSAVLTTESFNDPWMKSISIRSCTVQEMDTLLRLNHLSRPDKLEKLCFDPELYVDADMIELIIRKFRNLRQLTIFTEDVSELKNFDEEAVTKGTSSTLMARLDDQFQLTAVDVKFDTSKWKLKWNIKLKPQTLDKYYEIQNVMGPFGLSGISRVPLGRDLSKKSLTTVTLSIPFVQDRDRKIWLKVLQSQNTLKSLTCDLNATHWKEYATVILANCKTLQKLFLLNITCHTPTPTFHAEIPFDWQIFENCRALEEITLIADTFMRSASETSYFSEEIPKHRRHIETIHLPILENCYSLRSVWIENFKLTENDVCFLKTSGSHTDLSLEDNAYRFELCTLKNCLVNGEEVPESHLGKKKRRTLSFECLCFGTTAYDDKDLDNFEKYTASQASGESFLGDWNWDITDCFQSGTGKMEPEKIGACISKTMVENINLLGGVALTAWLFWCK